MQKAHYCKSQFLFLGRFLLVPAKFSFREYMMRLFQSSFTFGQVTSSHFLFRSSYFFRTTAFFEELLFQNSHFIAAVIFSDELLFKSETFTEQPLLKNRKFFTEVTFRNSYIFSLADELFRIKISTKELLFRSRYFCTELTFSEKLHFVKS